LFQFCRLTTTIHCSLQSKNSINTVPLLTAVVTWKVWL
jgi:hypothetical protein